MYSGVGGMDYAAHLAGIETVAFCESDEWNRTILARHWPGKPIFESDEQVTAIALREIGIDRIDIVAGGPPCQPFSVAGKGLGVADPRHRWPQMARVIAELRPSFALVENVAGFADVAEQLVRPELARLGYGTVRFDIPAAGVEAPHQRERISSWPTMVATPYGRNRAVSKNATERPSLERIVDSPSSLVIVAHGCIRIERLACGETDECSKPECVPRRILSRHRRPRLPDNDDRCHASRYESCRRDADREECRCASVADHDYSGCSEQRGTKSVRPKLVASQCRCSGELRGATVEHDASARREGRAECGIQRCFTAEGCCAGEPKSRLGGVLGWIADRMDEIRWPAPRLVYIDDDLKEWPIESPQHDWEPQRTASERHERRKRLKGLGNICVPQQVLPIFAIIRALVTAQQRNPKAKNCYRGKVL